VCLYKLVYICMFMCMCRYKFICVDINLFVYVGCGA